MIWFWWTLGAVVWFAVIMALAFAAINQLDGGSKLVGWGLVALAAVIFSAGVAAFVTAADNADKGRVCIKNSVIIIDGKPYSVCDEYATPLD